MKRIKLFAALLCLLLSLSSCRLTSFDTDMLLTPPQMNAANQEIQKTLASAVGGGYEPVYPKTGEHQTAIISVDLTGNGEDEALCFYTTGQDKKVSFSVLEKIDGAWSAQSMSHSQSAAAIDTVDFFDFDGDGTKEIIVGWQYLQGDEKALEVYDYSNSAKIESLFTGMYNNLIVFDDTLVTVSRNTTGKTASASLVGKSGKSVAVLGTAALNNSIAGVLNVQTARVDDLDIIYIDEQLENSLFTTELLTINNKNDISNATVSLGTLTNRNSTVICTDVDGDGTPDIPLERSFPSYKLGDKTETLYYIEWYGFAGGTPERIMNAYTSANEQFILQLPDEWTGLITAQRDVSSDRQIHFYMIGDEGNIPMFSLRVFSQQEFSDDVVAQGWSQIAESGENVYAFKSRASDRLPDAFKVDADRIDELFKIMS